LLGGGCLLLGGVRPLVGVCCLGICGGGLLLGGGDLGIGGGLLLGGGLLIFGVN
jgi:hypothetical protein